MKLHRIVMFTCTILQAALAIAFMATFESRGLFVLYINPFFIVAAGLGFWGTLKLNSTLLILVSSFQILHSFFAFVFTSQWTLNFWYDSCKSTWWGLQESLWFLLSLVFLNTLQSINHGVFLFFICLIQFLS